MNKLFFVTLMGCTSSLALAFGVPGVDLKVGNDVQNAMTALQVLQDGGVKCNEITSMKPHSSGTKVQCDGKKYYILIKNSKGEYVMKTN